jgi:hypothetical protein
MELVKDMFRNSLRQLFTTKYFGSLGPLQVIQRIQTPFFIN